MKLDDRPDRPLGTLELQNEGPGCPVQRRSAPGAHASCASYPPFSASEPIHSNPQLLSLLPLTLSSTAFSTAQEVLSEEAPMNQTTTKTVTHVSGSKCHPCSGWTGGVRTGYMGNNKQPIHG